MAYGTVGKKMVALSSPPSHSIQLFEDVCATGCITMILTMLSLPRPHRCCLSLDSKLKLQMLQVYIEELWAGLGVVQSI